MTRKLTEFQFYRNTPLVDFHNTIHFHSFEMRDEFFMSGTYPTIKFSTNFNYIKDRSSVNINYPYMHMGGVNYCMFKTEGDDTRYYAHVDSIRYVNDRVTKVNLLIDPVMTYIQGDYIQTDRPVEIVRQSLPLDEYNIRINELKNNDDVLKTYSKKYFEESEYIFTDFIVLIESSVNLSADFGTVNNPKIKSSIGTQADGISSPLNLYYVDSLHFMDLMEYLTDYPWIVQNIKKATIIPEEFMDTDLPGKQVYINNDRDTVDLKVYQIRRPVRSDDNTIENNINRKLGRTMKELYDMFNLDENQDRHLLRNEYGTVELYNYSGESLYLDLGKLSEWIGLEFEVNMISGFYNELKIYPKGYNVDLLGDEKTVGGDLNNSIGLKGFDEVPMVIDNYKLTMASTANKRQLNEDRQLITGRGRRLLSPEVDWKEKTMDAFSALVNVIDIDDIGSRVLDEYEYYRDRKAEEKDLALTGNTITQQTYNNAFLIANKKYGLHIKFSRPSESELESLKKYYKMFGFEGNNSSGYPSSITSNTMANYLQFKGSWNMDGIDPALMKILKLRMEMGVRFWHYNWTANPMKQDIINNRMK